jgi:Snare region anchored in the vesicle membrane C-terminus/Vesicle transport v-SNARE protein N-terminus
MSSEETNLPFQRYDDEFSELIQQIERSLEEDPPSGYTENLLRQADDLLKQMSMEARSVENPNVKRDLLAQVRSLKTKLATLQSKSDKGGLFRVNGSGPLPRNDRDRLLLQKNEDLLSSQNETLERARRTMEETEQVALEITEELGHNRETLMSARGRVQQVSGLTGRARRILSSMNQRAMQQKLIMYGVAVGLVLGVLILLYTLWG